MAGTMGDVLKYKQERAKRKALRRGKLLQLVADYGFSDLEEAMAACLMDSVNPGICMTDGCDYSIDVEPDCHDGYCEECGKNTVVSLGILSGLY